MSFPSVARVEKKSLRLDDEMHFIRSWFEKPLATGAVMPSGRALAFQRKVRDPLWIAQKYRGGHSSLTQRMPSW